MADEKPEPVVYRLTLRALAGPVPPEVRLRKLLKAALRAWGFRCTEIVLVPPPAKEERAADG